MVKHNDAPATMGGRGVFPTLRSCLRLFEKGEGHEGALYDVQFYPYPTEGDDPVFAVCGGREVFICRPVNEGTGIEVLRWWQDDNVCECDG